MGKTKRNRVKAKASNPTVLPSVRDIEREEDEFGANGDGKHMSKQESTIQALLEMLQSPNIEDKVIGLQTLATVFDAPESIGDVMKHKVVKVAAPLLFDKSTAVRNAAAGALRNLSACGSHEICDLLVEQDVMTPLSALIQKYADDWQPSKKKSEDKLDEVTDTFTQAVHLLWNLCESNGTAVKYFNSGNLLPVLVKCLEVGVFGVDTAIAVAQCLHTVTEENPAAVSKLQSSSPALQKLLNLEGCDSPVLLLRTLACGLILDLNYGKVSSLSPTIVTQIMCSLTTTLTTNHRKVVNDFTSSVPLDEAVETSKKHTEILKSVTDIQYLIEAQKIAIELLANICSGDDADDDAMDQDSSGNSSDDVLSDSGLPEDDCAVAEKFSLSIPSEVHEAIISGQLVEKVWDKAQLPAENVSQILKKHEDGKQIFNRLCTLRCHALLCMNNLVAGLDIQDLGGRNDVYQLWLNMGTLIFKQTGPTDTRFLEAATAALRASLQKLAEAQCHDLFGQMTESDLQLMFDTEVKCPDENVRANLIRSIGMLGMILTKSLESSEHALILLKNIGKFLLDVCVRETQLWVIAEAVDSIMDVFGEDETDLAAAQVNLVEKLQALLPALKSKVRLQRKSLGDHYLVVTTVNTNLSRFIKYKSKRVSLIGQTNGHCK